VTDTADRIETSAPPIDETNEHLFDLPGMSNLTKNRLTSVAAAVVAMFGLLSPAAASDQNAQPF
jgi:hypothetical protein